MSNQLVRFLAGSSAARTRNRRRARVRLQVESLGDRTVPSITPLADDTLANTSRGGDQVTADTAMDAAGGYVVVWESVPGHLMAHLYDSDGNTIAVDADGGDFPILDPGFPPPRGGGFPGPGPNPAPDGFLPRVAMDAEGSFVVVWETSTSGNSDVRGRLCGPDGHALGPDFAIAADPNVNESAPAVGMDHTGRWVVAWQQPNPVTYAGDIMIRRYDLSPGGQVSSNYPVGANFLVNQNSIPIYPPGGILSADQPAVDTDGGVVQVAWTYNSGDAIPDYWIKVATRNMTFDNAIGSNAPAASNEILVHDLYPYPTPGPYPVAQTRASVALSPDGATGVVAWQENSVAINMWSDDPYYQNVFGRMFHNEIVPGYSANIGFLGDAFRVNELVAGNQYTPDVAMNDRGFVVVWVSSPAGTVFVPPGPPQDGDQAGVIGRQYSYDPVLGATAVTGDVVMNAITANNQILPAVGLSDSFADGLAKMAVAWQGFDPTDANGDGFPDFGWDIYSRRFQVTFR